MGGVITLGEKSMGSVEPAEQFGYNGPDIVAGSYRVKTGPVWMHGSTKGGDPRITVPCVIDEPKGSPKAKFNGFTIWHGMNITEQGAPFNNAFLKSCEIDPKAFFGAKAKTEDGNKPGTLKITKVQGIEIGGHLLAVTIREKDGFWNISTHSAWVMSDAADEAADGAAWEDSNSKGEDDPWASPSSDAGDDGPEF